MRASSVARAGTVTTSACHCSHGPDVIAGTSLSISCEPISGVVAQATVPPSAHAATWLPKQIANTGHPAWRLLGSA